MKYTKYFLLMFVILSFFVACKKDNDNTSDQDKIIKVVIENPVGENRYKGVLTVSGTIDKNQKKVPVTGLQWDEEIASGEVILYSKTLDSLTSVLQFQTEAPASIMQFGYTTWTDSTAGEITSKINIYLNDELLESDSYKSGNNITKDTYIKTVVAN